MKTRFKKCERCGRPADYCVRLKPADAAPPQPFLAQRCRRCLDDLDGEARPVSSFEITQTYRS